jgi:hypothetical protein
MRNTTSLFLTLISYLIMLGTILALLFAAMPMSLRAQTNLSAGTNLSSVIATTNGLAAETNSLQKNQPNHSDNTSGNAGGDNSISMKAMLISALPLLIPFAPFAMVVAIVFFALYFKNHRNKLAHETLRAMIEKGVPMTPELIASLNVKAKANEESRNPQARYLLPGLILVGAGIGVMTQAGKPGLIVLFIGVAFLIVWLVERKRYGAEQHTVSITKQGIQIVQGKQNSTEQSSKP